MEIIAISFLVGAIMFGLGIACGKASPCCSHNIEPIEPYYCTCVCGGNWCHKTHCTPNCWKYNRWDIPYGKTLAQAEAERKAENRGYEKGYERGLMEKMYNSSSSRKDEFLVQFSDAIKPLEELKKEFKIN